MQIKNMAQFRSLWKKSQGYEMTNWNEHFIGSNFEQINGFYKMVNGIVENIKADMTPKLQNAQDEQAIYEFLQNAADSAADACAVIYDENFFMVLNNGKPFTEADVKAVLNSFQGTKADKTKPENCEKIGRYGIGFKLVHRLVGKSDGADELLNNLAGTIIYSWNSAKQWDDLLKFSTEKNIQLTDNQEDAAWLFKIVLACFPASPNEQVKNLSYKDQIVFPKNELTDLVQFLERHSERLQQMNLNRGSLFFLKFGEKKHEKLKESLINLRSGIGYSLNMLKTLRKVVLQDEILEQFTVQTEKFSILPDSDEFKKIDPEFPFCPIDITFGYQTDYKEIERLKKSPTIYQFFPMRSELHNLAFLVHATSFAKVTDRTRLDEQGEANFETFKFLVQALKERLNNYKKTDLQRFSQIFKAILLSEPSERFNQKLINETLFEPLLNYIKHTIPTNKGNFYPKDLVLLKKTALSIEPMHFGIAKEWFFWTEQKDEICLQEAEKAKKLALTAWTLKDLLREGTLSLINTWFENSNPQEYDLFVNELKSITFDKEFLSKFSQIKCFKFTDLKGKSAFYALEELKNNPTTFLINEKTEGIQNELQAIGFLVFRLNQKDFGQILESIEKELAYLQNNDLLFQKINEQCRKNNDKLLKMSVLQKHKLFLALKNLKGIAANKLKDLFIFANQRGEIRPLKALLSSEVEVENWLNIHRINPEEEIYELKEYFLKVNDIYAELIEPFWDSICQNPTINNELEQFYESVQKYFKLSPSSKPLTDKKIVFIDEAVGFVSAEKVFYSPKIAEIENKEALKNAIFLLSEMYLPKTEILRFLDVAPFKTPVFVLHKNFQKLFEQMLQNLKNDSLQATEKWAIWEMFGKILDKSRFEKLAIFANQNNELRTLKELISNELVVPKWLESYKIRPSEQHPVLAEQLLQEDEIFAKIIYPSWDTLTETILPTFTDETKVKSFYEDVKKYFEYKKNNPLLSSKKYVFTGSNFSTNYQIFYQTELAEAKNYVSLQNALLKLTNLETPNFSVLPFLSDLPFKTPENSIFRVLRVQEAVLTENEIKELLLLSCQKKEAIFTFLTIEKTNEGYLVAKKGINTPIFTENNPKLEQAVIKYFGERYKIFPANLFSERLNDKGLLYGKALMQELSKKAKPETMSEILVSGKGKEIASDMIDKMSEIVLKEGQIFDSESFVHQAFQFFRSREADTEKLRQKIVLETQNGERHKLVDIAFSETIAFQIDRLGKFELNLGLVLPKFTTFFALIDKIISQFTDFSDHTLRRKVFGNAEIDKNKVWQLLKNEPILENAHQVAFMLLLAKMQNNVSLLKGFQVYTQTGLENIGDLNLYLTENELVSPKNILDKRYQVLSDLLKLDKHKFLFLLDNQRVSLELGFEKNSFFVKDLDINQSWNTTNFLNLVFEKWLSAEKPENIELIGYSQMQLLGFQGVDLVDSKWALEDEKIPDWLANWADKDEKIQFLKALGVHTSDSDLVALRRFLSKNEGQISQKNLNELKKSAIFAQTLRWLLTKKIIFFGDTIFWLRKVLAFIEVFDEKIPLPFLLSYENETWKYGLDFPKNFDYSYIDEQKLLAFSEKYDFNLNEFFEIQQTVFQRVINFEIKNLVLENAKVEEKLDISRLENEALEWAADYYQSWKTESSFEIYLFDGKMPYKLYFSDQLVKHFEKENAVIDGQRIFVNRNSENIEEELFSISKSTSGLTQNHLLQLLRLKNTKMKAVKNEVQDFSFIIEKIQQKFPELDFSQSTKTKNIIRKVQKDNLEISILIKNAKNLHFNFTEMQVLHKENAELYVFDGENVDRLAF